MLKAARKAILEVQTDALPAVAENETLESEAVREILDQAEN